LTSLDAYHEGMAPHFRLRRGIAAFPLLFGLAWGAQDWSHVTVPSIKATVEIPHPTASSTDTGPFDGGKNAKPFVVDDETKRKLNGLAKEYEDVARDNYALILRELRLPADLKSKPVQIVVTYAYDGVAATTGAGFGSDPTAPVIEVSAKYALAHPKDLGMIVHEMVHVVQSYPTYDPVWLVEGIADYVRWFFYEPIASRPKPNPARATARDSYQTTGAFLYWASTHYDLNLVPKLSAAFQANQYKESMFKDLTGHTLDELNTMWLASLPKRSVPK
jgi:hypothetical protein